MSHPDELLAALDANVHNPQWLHDVMLTLAAMGYFQPRWSSHIIERTQRRSHRGSRSRAGQPDGETVAVLVEPRCPQHDERQLAAPDWIDDPPGHSVPTKGSRAMSHPEGRLLERIRRS